MIGIYPTMIRNIKFMLLILVFCMLLMLWSYPRTSYNAMTRGTNGRPIEGPILKFASYYGSYMVLQQASSNIIWGHAHPKYIGQDVTITVIGQGAMYSTKSQILQKNADNRAFPEEGKWSLQIGPRSAGGPYTISVSSGSTTISISDVMFGDVWICSGQSNMEFTVSMEFNATKEIQRAANYPNVRLFTAAQHQSGIPLDDLAEVEQQWSVASPESIGGRGNWTYFSAVCWEYGRRLHDNLKYPIGLVASTWGGTPIQAWSSPEALNYCKDSIELGRKQTEMKETGPSAHSVLYNAMIHPLLNLTIAGVIWYQGESNAGSTNYDCRFYSLIKDWRDKFRKGSLGGSDLELPFGFVQLAPYRKSSQLGLASIRWQQTNNYGFVPNQDLRNVFMAVTIDLPDFSSRYGAIHPRDKETVGARLSKAGLSVAYGKSVGRYLGPFPTAFIVNYDAKTLQLQVDDNKTSLIIRQLPGFQVCCASRDEQCSEISPEWQPAEIITNTSINYNILIKWNCNSEKIMGLRYLWSDSPCSYLQCPVYSKDGDLPMPPFAFLGEFRMGRMTVGNFSFISASSFTEP